MKKKVDEIWKTVGSYQTRSVPRDSVETLFWWAQIEQNIVDAIDAIHDLPQLDICKHIVSGGEEFITDYLDLHVSCCFPSQCSRKYVDNIIKKRIKESPRLKELSGSLKWCVNCVFTMPTVVRFVLQMSDEMSNQEAQRWMKIRDDVKPKKMKIDASETYFTNSSHDFPEYD
jgi:hypothetical protein